MLRFLQILLVLVFVRILWGAIRMMLTRPQTASSGGSPRPGAAFEEMVRCDRCGLHVPADRILHGERGSYCPGPCEPGEG